MNYWGKFIGGMAGFAMGGPVGALFGAALGHAADEGKLHPFSSFVGRSIPFDPLRVAALLGQGEQVFAICVTVLAAKLCKCDGPVSQKEIDAFRRSFTSPPEGLAGIALMFDKACASPEGFESYATELGQAFAADMSRLEQVLAALYQIARADGPLNDAEAQFLSRAASLMGLSEAAYRRAGQGMPAPQAPAEDPYAVLGVTKQMGHDEIRSRWKQLMRETHPDSLAAKGASVLVIQQASERVARINAAYDFIKRTKGEAGR